jgi:hypothetical protein
MNKTAIVGVVLLLMLAPLSIAAAGNHEVPRPGVLPRGMAVRVFVHPAKGQAPGLERIEAASIYQEDPGNDATQFSYSGIRWQDPSGGGSGIPYWVNTNFSTRKSPNLTKAQAVSAIDAAFDTWEAAQAAQTDGQLSGPGLLYRNAGATTASGPKLDGKNVVAWKPLPSGYIAVTYVWYYTATGYIAEFDILFNNSYSWTYTPPAGIDDNPATYEDPSNLGPAQTFDVRDIATHEAGHTLMLEDIYDDNDGVAGEQLLTMYGYAGYSELLKDTLQRGDHLGVCYIYP